MVYTEYATAAERHIETCIHLLGVLETQYQSKESESGLLPREQKEKLELLSNLYYLSGYIIECAYSYALCKHIALDSTIDIERQLPSGKVCWNQNQVGKKKKDVNTGTDIIPAHAIYRSKHKMSINEMSYFQSSFTSTTGKSVTSIPIIGGKNMSDSAAQQLFDDWSAEVRYTVTTFLDYSNVFKFFYACEEIYRLTRQIITTDYP